nr:MarR family transcriptional regulator [uncultured Caproiciproducens sp.]
MEQKEKDKLLEAIHSLKRAQTWLPSTEGISRGEYFTLHTIHHLTEHVDDSKPGAKITDLSNAAQMSKPAVSQMLNILEDKKLIERVMAKSDRRVVYVKLTEAGAEQLKRTHQQFHYWFDQIIEELGEEDTAELARLVNKLHTIMENLQECK